MDVRIKLVEDVTWVASGDSGHGMVIDGAPSIGGKNLGMRPMEMLLVSLGGCTAMDVASILRKQRQEVTDIEIRVNGERATEVPKVFTRIELTYVVYGRGLRADAVERAVNLSRETYCSVSKMLEQSVSITHTVQIIES